MSTVTLTFYVFAIVLASSYLVWRLGVNITASSLLLVALLLLHGPAYLHYCWSYGPGTLIYERAMENGDPRAILATLNMALGLMFLGVISGMELVNRLMPVRAERLSATIRNWNSVPSGRTYLFNYRVLLIGLLFFAGMLAVSIHEDQVGKIIAYLQTGGGEFDKIKIRHELGGSHSYLYNLVLYALGPFVSIIYIVIWRQTKNRVVLLLALLLISAVLLGKLSTLSKAPAVIFLLQIALSMLAFRRIRLTFGFSLFVVLVVAVLFTGVVMLAIPDISLSGSLNFLYYRIFMISNEVLVEYFSAIPSVIDFGWGYGIRLISALAGYQADYLPAYTAVAEVTRGSQESTSTAMFIADAWAEFSWIGVFLYSFIFSALLRGIDFYALRKGKSDEAIAILAGVTYGIFTALSTSLTTALLSGGLLTVPLLSLMLHIRVVDRLSIQHHRSFQGSVVPRP